MMENEQTEQISSVEWEAEEFETHPRDLNWYVVRGGLLLPVVVYFIYIKNWILLATALMLGVVLFLTGKLKSKILRCKVDGSGVTINDKALSYDQLKTFWFSNIKGAIKLHLISTFKLMTVISLNISNIESENKIRSILSQFLPESKNKGEDLVDKVNRFLKL
ncbi:hypothetical protein KKE14_01750 [Patescibacteria group bacterium]|nr:hypothetical protein [Patescibacteria group bacterium]